MPKCNSRLLAVCLWARAAVRAGPPRSLDGCSSLTYIRHRFYHGTVHAFDVLGDPVRRRILELLAEGELSSGSITEIVGRS